MIIFCLLEYFFGDFCDFIARIIYKADEEALLA